MSLEDQLISAIDAAAARAPERLLVVGLCGAQGSGKSTLASALPRRLDHAVTLSLDDLYLTRSEREALARHVHPLFVTRGVPGTHDVDLGLSVIESLRAGRDTPLPRFDKAIDDRAGRSAWPVAPGGTRILIFEGWCVGAAAQAPAELATPVNELERDEDPEGIWRRHANVALATAYRPLFATIDLLVLLAAPGWDTVLSWRVEQEQALRRTRSGRGVMTDGEVRRFISHYQRLTGHILREMPSRADLVVHLDAQRRCRGE